MCKGSLKVKFSKLVFGVSALIFSTSAQSALLVMAFSGHVTDSTDSVSGQLKIDTALFDGFSTVINIDPINNITSLEYAGFPKDNIRFTSFAVNGSDYALPAYPTNFSTDGETLKTEIPISIYTTDDYMVINDRSESTSIGLTLQGFDFLNAVDNIKSVSSELLIGQGGGSYSNIISGAGTFFPVVERTLFTIDHIEISEVPIPAAVWLFGSGLIGLVGLARRKKV